MAVSRVSLLSFASRPFGRFAFFTVPAFRVAKSGSGILPDQNGLKIMASGGGRQANSGWNSPPSSDSVLSMSFKSSSALRNGACFFPPDQETVPCHVEFWALIT